jgi:hypothetical protein
MIPHDAFLQVTATISTDSHSNFGLARRFTWPWTVGLTALFVAVPTAFTVVRVVGAAF